MFTATKELKNELGHLCLTHTGGCRNTMKTSHQWEKPTSSLLHHGYVACPQQPAQAKETARTSSPLAFTARYKPAPLPFPVQSPLNAFPFLSWNVHLWFHELAEAVFSAFKCSSPNLANFLFSLHDPD